jgi:glc operon protein GlcG
MLRRSAAMVLTLDGAKAIGAAAEAVALAEGWTIAVAVVDAGANLLYFARMEAAILASQQGAINKATTAVRFGRTTQVIAEAVARGRLHYFAFPNVLPVEGGIPIVVDGAIVGGIGIGGTTVEGAATKCAEAGLAALRQ